MPVPVPVPVKVTAVTLIVAAAIVVITIAAVAKGENVRDSHILVLSSVPENCSSLENPRCAATRRFLCDPTVAGRTPR
jgi:hypothetical protein